MRRLKPSKVCVVVSILLSCSRDQAGAGGHGQKASASPEQVVVPAALTNIWIAHVDGREASIELPLAAKSAADLPIQLRRERDSAQALGSEATERWLSCLRGQVPVDLGRRLPKEFSPGGVVRLAHLGVTRGVDVRALSARCERGTMVVELELPEDLELPRDAEGVGSGASSFALVLVAEASGAGPLQPAQPVEAVSRPEAIAAVLRADFERARVREEQRLGGRFDLDEDLANSDAASLDEFFAMNVGVHVSWPVPSGGIVAVADVRRQFSGLSAAGHELQVVYALQQGGGRCGVSWSPCSWTRPSSNRTPRSWVTSISRATETPSSS
ncbi:hypothetical protein G6O69_24665 [Pseudenhygromyxa sp. WMMC2535]|uniref:hypothetical protein n=1 Tax=Pseudenhygromyxa sp. WMMC2535 TaxID=2712867 RepID=UPI001554DBA5|nr:hypothetical protein [Pseudenhygromyxa sp. WMMC2535]NVB41056.1 hypothetical protein [Pseudenhygromyxa sp. WMMC2535]